jgi:5-methylcytosine-specific restriction endonuclease McrA
VNHDKHLLYLIEMNEYLRQQIKHLEHEVFFLLENTENRPRITEKVRRKVLVRDQFQCVECQSREKLQVHHLLAVAEGGLNKISNMITLCLPCHIKRHEGEIVEPLMRSQL